MIRADTLPIDEVEEMFDRLPDAPFFIKDANLRYVAVNSAMVELCYGGDKSALIGARAGDIFAEPLSRHFEELDRRILASGKAVKDCLEYVSSIGGKGTWLLYDRRPVTTRDGRVAGVMAVARRLRFARRGDVTFERVARAAEHIRENFAKPLDVTTLADAVGMSVAQFERNFRHILGVSPRNYLVKCRLEEALGLLRGEASIADVAYSCGYKDQSAFTRQFHAVIGTTPRAYRQTRLPS